MFLTKRIPSTEKEIMIKVSKRKWRRFANGSFRYLILAALVLLSSFRLNDEYLALVMTQSPPSLSNPSLWNPSLSNPSLSNPGLEKGGGLHVVVSHCSQPLDWIFERYIAGITFKSFTIITKCGQPPFSAVTIPSHGLIRIETLPNVGRCDHSYAYWIKQMLDSRNNKEVHGDFYHPNDQVLFIKDHDNSYRRFEMRRSLSEMRNRTALRGFSCGSYVAKHPARRFATRVCTTYADIQMLGDFTMNSYIPAHKGPNVDTTPFQAPLRPMSIWTEKMHANISYTTEGIVEVCFGGVFMSTIKKIENAPLRNWSTIIESLSRGDNIEEGHYMERLWGPLLAPPVPKEKQEVLRADEVEILSGTSTIVLRPGSTFVDE